MPAAAVGLVVIGAAVAAFSGVWSNGDLVLDGPGASLWVGIALDQWHGGLPAWMPHMWAGAPAWFLVPWLPVLSLAPLASVVGPDGAVKAASLASQIVGGLGVVVLARSLWPRPAAAALVAGFLYALHPLLVAHVALAGFQPSAAVAAATPWLLWALLGALDGRGRRWVAGAGLLAGVAVLEQPEQAYGVVLLAAVVTATAALRASPTGTPAGAGARARVVGRAAAVAAVGLGVAAGWLLPFSVLHRSFVLAPGDLVRASLASDMGGRLGRDPGQFVTRAHDLAGPVSFRTVDLFSAHGFYLSRACLALAAVTVVALARRRGDDVLPAVLLASVLAVWFSTGGVALAAGRLGSGTSLVWAVLGLVVGVLVAGFLRSLGAGRRAIAVYGTATAALLAGAPYVAPFLVLRRLVPFLAQARFPRLYPVAVLGLVLAAAWPLTLVHGWAWRRRPALAPALTVAAALVVAGAFLVDVRPYRSFYRARAVSAADGPQQAAAGAAEAVGAGDARAASYSDPSAVAPLYAAGVDQSTGWPFAIAGRDVWRLTAEAIDGSPPGWRDRALGLSATTRRLTDTGPGTAGAGAGAVAVVPVAGAQPRVRVYEQAVIVGDRSLAPELAVGLAGRHLAVVTGAARPGDVPVAGEVGAAPCGPGAQERRPGRDGRSLAADVASACAVHRWVGIRDGITTIGVRSNPGGVFDAPLDGLRGVAVWLDRPAGATELTLSELGSDSRTVGRVVSRSTSASVSDYGMALFPVAEGAVSPGRRYVFTLSCGGCGPVASPRMFATGDARGPADLVVDGRIDSGRVAAFDLAHDGGATGPAPTTTAEAAPAGPGRWRIDTAGERAALVVVAESWFPGWEARVDGRRVPVVEADGAFVGVPVGPGHHRVTLRFRAPAAAPIGNAVSVLTVVGALAAMAWPSRASRQPRSAAAAPTAARSPTS